MSPLRTISLAALCLLPATLFLPTPAATAAAPARTCSVAGPTFISTDGTAVFSVSVADLTVRGAGCGVAHSLARDVARRDLKDGRVPRASGAFKVRSVAACAGCTPRTKVVATRGDRKVTFTLLGGQ